jgi:hypothetical protein
VKHLRQVPNSLTVTQKAERVTLSNESLRELRSIKHHGWQFIITFDELWFSLVPDHKHIGLRPDEQPPERPRHTIQDPKMMLTIAWNPLAFHVLDSLPNGRIVNAKYYHNKISQHCFRFPSISMRENSLFVQILQGPHNSKVLSFVCRKLAAVRRTPTELA